MGLLELGSVGDQDLDKGTLLVNKGRMKDLQPSSEIGYCWATNLTMMSLSGLCWDQLEEQKGNQRAV